MVAAGECLSTVSGQRVWFPSARLEAFGGSASYVLKRVSHALVNISVIHALFVYLGVREAALHYLQVARGVRHVAPVSQ